LASKLLNYTQKFLNQISGFDFRKNKDRRLKINTEAIFAWEDLKKYTLFRVWK